MAVASSVSHRRGSRGLVRGDRRSPGRGARHRGTALRLAAPVSELAPRLPTGARLERCAEDSDGAPPVDGSRSAYGQLTRTFVPRRRRRASLFMRKPAPTVTPAGLLSCRQWEARAPGALLVKAMAGNRARSTRRRLQIDQRASCSASVQPSRRCRRLPRRSARHSRPEQCRSRMCRGSGTSALRPQRSSRHRVRSRTHDRRCCPWR